MELGCGGLETLEGEIAVAQDVDLAAFHAPVHATRHLEDFVGAEVQPRQHVAAARDDVRVARVVDHDGVEPADVERGLAGGGHGQEKGPPHLAVQKGADDPDRLPAVVERGRQSLPPIAKLLRERGPTSE